MYLPKIKTKVENARLKLPDGTFKNGNVIRTFLGEVYEGDKITKDSKRLRDLDLMETLSYSEQVSIFKTEIPKPSEKEMKKGTFKRYFIQDKRNQNINEVSKITFTNFKDNLYTDKIAIDWQLNSPAKDVFFKGVKYEGSETKNKKITLKASEKMKGLYEYITDYSEFIPTSNIAEEKFENKVNPIPSFDLPSPSSGTVLSKVKREPPVIENNKIRENLYAYPGQFINVDTGTEYVGLYHEHPKLGAMVGAVHTSTKHSKLERIVNKSDNQKSNIIPESTPTTTSTPNTSTTTSGGGYGGY